MNLKIPILTLALLLFSGFANSEGKMINAIITTEAVVEDPILAKGYQQFQILGLLSDTLIQKQGKYQVSAGVSDRWTISEDQKTFEFHINTDRLFANGQKITPNEVKLSFERLLKPRPLPAMGTYLDMVLGHVELGKENSVIFKLKGPYPNFLEMLAMPGMGIFKETDGKVVGSGPFVVSSHQDKKWCLTKSPSYSGKHSSIDGYCFTVERDAEKSIALIASGEVDLAIGSPLEVALSDKIQNRAVSSSAFSLVTNLVFFNFHNPYFKEKKNREAAASVLLKARNHPDFLTKFDQPLDSFFPFGILQEDYYSQGHKRAKTICATEPKTANGQKLKIVFPFGIFKESSVLLMVNAFKQAGFDVEYVNVKGKEYGDPIIQNRFDILFMPYLGILPDPDGFMDLLNPHFVGGNFKTPTSETISAVNTARFSKKEDDRMAAYGEAFLKFENDFLMVPFAQNGIPIVASRKIKLPNLNFNFLNLREIDIE